jgi:IS605 OrfB family transposase
MFLTYKYRIKSNQGLRALRRHVFAINQVWNYLVSTQRKIQQDWKFGLARNWPSQYDFQKLTGNTSKDLGVHGQSIYGTCEQFVKSRDQHKKNPRFRRSSSPKKSLGWIPFLKQSRQITGNSITYLGRTYKVFGTKRRPIPEGAKGGCFVEDSRGRWYVCFQVEVEKDQEHGQGKVGIDLGLKTLATLSNGQKIENPRSYRKLEEKLGIAQRANNKKRVKVLHDKIKNVRKDYLHKESNKLIKNNCLIVVGNVSASQLAKTKMAKSVLDAGWTTFRSMLNYKASRHSASYLEVDERFTTQTCSACGLRPESRPKGIAGLGIREWVCSDCGVVHDRDINAAQNILKLGRSVAPLAEERPFRSAQEAQG